MKRALLVASQTLGLRACNSDVALMAETLTELGFEDLRTLEGPAACRVGILEGLDWLIRVTTAQDGAVFYYSGHGARTLRRDYQDAGATATDVYQYLVPTDMMASTPDDFRGILAQELENLLLRLTNRFTDAGLATANVTTILDCCFSGYMARGAVAAKQKSPGTAEAVWNTDGIGARLMALPNQTSFNRRTEGNPFAVRIAACQAYQAAYEQQGDDGAVHGVLTAALCSILRCVKDRRLAWTVVRDQLLQQVLARRPEQRPDVEGPDRMILFSLDEEVDRASLPAVLDNGTGRIELATLLGLAIHDQFQLRDPMTLGALGTFEVSSIDNGTASLTRTTTSPSTDVGTTLPLAVEAVPIHRHLPRYPVAVDAASCHLRDSIKASLKDSDHLRWADSEEPPFLTIDASSDGIRVRDAAGAVLRNAPMPVSPVGVRAAIELSEVLAMSRRLADLPSGEDVGLGLGHPVRLEFEVDDGSGRELRPRAGARVDEGASISLGLHNQSDRPVYVSVFDIGLSGSACLVTSSHPSGIRLERQGNPRAAYTIWDKGQQLYWPPDVPREPATGTEATPVERPETFLVLALDRPQSLGVLATKALSVSPTRRGKLIRDTNFGLHHLLMEVAASCRARPRNDAGTVRYSVERVEFFVRPHPAARPDRHPEGIGLLC